MQDNLQPTTVIYYDSTTARVKEKMCYVEIMFPFLSFFFLFLCDRAIFMGKGQIANESVNYCGDVMLTFGLILYVIFMIISILN